MPRPPAPPSPRLRGGGSARFETLLRRKDGAVVEIEIDAKPLPDGSGAARIAAVIRDLTPSRRAGRQNRGKVAPRALRGRNRNIRDRSRHGALCARRPRRRRLGPRSGRDLMLPDPRRAGSGRGPPAVKNALDIASDAKSAGDRGPEPMPPSFAFAAIMTGLCAGSRSRVARFSRTGERSTASA